MARSHHGQQGVVGQRLPGLHLDGAQELLEVRLELAHRLVAGRHILGRRLFENALQPFGNGRIDGRQRRERLMHDGVHDIHRAFALKWEAAGCHFVDDDAQREHIRTGINRAATGLLRRHVTGRAKGNTGLGQLHDGLIANVFGRGFRQAKIENLGLSTLIDNDVGGFDIPVNDAPLMRCGQRIGQLDSNGEGAFHIQRPPPYHLLEAFAFEVLHDDEMQPTVLVDFIDRADVRVVKRRSELGFAEKPLAGFSSATSSAGRILMATMRRNRVSSAW